MSELFSNPSGRIFALYGNTDDYFITPQLRELNIAQWLLAHLQHLGYRRVVYYSVHKKIHFLDKESAQLAQPQNTTASSTHTAKNENPKLVGGAMGHARIRRKSNTQRTETTLSTPDNFRWDYGSMKDSQAVEALDKWMKEDINTAIVFLNGTDIFRHLDADAVRHWDDKLSNWKTANFSMDNKNLAIFVFLNDINIPARLPNLQSVLVTVSEENQLPRPERCFSIGAAKQDEVRSLLHRRRLQKKLNWTPLQIEQRAVPLAQNLTPEKITENIKSLAHLNHELATQKEIFMQQNPWEALKNLDGLGAFIEPKLRALVRVAKAKLARFGQTSELLSEHHIARLSHRKAINNDKLANLHLVLLGNPGTGKTTLARLIAQIYRAEGILETGHLVEVTRKDLVAGYVGQTALNTSAAIERAMGGVLFIDEAYTLNEGGENDFGKEAIATLLKAMSDYKGQFAVIIAGYTKEITDFIENANPGLGRRFPERWHLQDYPPDVLFRIFCNELDQEGYQLDKTLAVRLPSAFEQWYKMRGKQFGNAGEVKNLVQSLVSTAFERDVVTEENFASLPGWSQYLGLHVLPSVDELLQPLNHLVGLDGKDGVRTRLASLCNTLNTTQRRTNSLIGTPPGHYVFTGNPGTGKTTVARLMGDMFHRLGLLQKGHVIEVTAKDLLGMYEGEAEKNMSDALRRAQHGVLFIDEAYQLIQSPLGQRASETLLASLENQRQQLCVIVAGYPEEMEKFIESNSGFESRFSKPIKFDDYNPRQLLTIACNELIEKGFHLGIETEECLLRLFAFLYNNRKKGFGNARDVRKLIEEDIIPTQATRLSTDLTAIDEVLSCIEVADIPIPQGFRPQDWDDAVENSASPDSERVLEELNRLVGLSEVKQQIRDLADRLAVEKRRGRGNTLTGHYVFTGNPGTGKTTVAKLMGRIFRALGLLAKGHVVPLLREDVGRFLGDAENNTKEKIIEALDGILFIDEAYQLTANNQNGHNSYGKAVIDTLLTNMENYRDRLCVIVAGYPSEMQQFIASDPGLPSRFTNTVYFSDYNAKELLQIALDMFTEQQFKLTEAAQSAVAELMQSWVEQKSDDFSNARDVRNLVSIVVTNQSRRLKPLLNTASNEMLDTIEVDDIPHKKHKE